MLSVCLTACLLTPDHPTGVNKGGYQVPFLHNQLLVWIWEADTVPPSFWMRLIIRVTTERFCSAARGSNCWCLCNTDPKYIFMTHKYSCHSWGRSVFCLVLPILDMVHQGLKDLRMRTSEDAPGPWRLFLLLHICPAQGGPSSVALLHVSSLSLKGF